ncbi:MAG: M14 family zinc carboxypeptidase [Bacteroidota bacterium]
MFQFSRLTIVLLCTIPTLLLSQRHYSRAKITLDEQSMPILNRLGVDLTHGTLAKGRFFICDFSEQELQQFATEGLSVDVLIEDVQTYYQTQAQAVSTRNTLECDNSNANDELYPVPENYSNGSYAGYFTYQELLEQLDSMHSKFPELISAKTPIEGGQSFEGRPIYWLRISDNPNTDEAEAEVLHTALHHAREPGSLSQMIFFMWYLLENYDSDPSIQFLVDETEFYFIPCINPDGYIYNEQTNPAGGGLWRKNRRFNADETYGVDLNRNYAFQWGFDDQGSSTNTTSQTYRGTAPFSEPETQAVRDFCNAHEFELALNYHTWGNLLIYPWGFNDLSTPDSTTFRAIARAMTSENEYTFGTGSETVGYPVNGDADDWMYGEQTTKPLIFSMTPEVGSQGFWPAEADIIPNNQACMLMNLTTARVLYNYGIIEESNPLFLTDLEGDFYFTLEQLGFEPGDLTVRLEPLSANILAVGDPEIFDLATYTTTEDFISYVLASDTQVGDTLRFRLVLDNGDYETSQEIIKLYGSPISDFFEDGNSLAQWQQDEEPDSDWGISTTRFKSAPSSITDSPFSEYENSVINTLTTNEYIEVAGTNRAFLNFWASWSIEAVYDYVQLQAVLDDDTTIPLCGKYTKIGSAFQAFEEPIYDGTSDWVPEEIDLSPLRMLADSFRLRFVLVADDFVDRDGFYFDDLTVTFLRDQTVSTQQFDQPEQWLLQNRPNPTSSTTIIPFGAPPSNAPVQLEIFNPIGERMLQQLIAPGQQQLEVQTKAWPAGVYFYRLSVNGQVGPSKKMTVVR